jgi:aryl-alcohol dehydrogenase-like predicted oxidoreductase
LKASIAGIEVGRIGLGCFALSGAYGSARPEDAARTIHAALDLGANLLDTSDAYAAGENERVVGRSLLGRRHDAIIATKFGWLLDASGRAVGLDSSPEHVRQACQASLERLSTDHIDVYLQHRVDPATPIEETVGELVRLRDEGKIRAFGLSEAGPATIRRATGVAPCAALETEYSLWSREPENELLPLCIELGVTFIAYSPLGRGFLAGAVREPDDLEPDDFRRSQPRFEADNLESNLTLLDSLIEVATGAGCSLAQLALAWVLAHPAGIVPIPATRHAEHVADNVRALEVRLDGSDLAAIAAILASAPIRGARHPEAHMRTIGL